MINKKLILLLILVIAFGWFWFSVVMNFLQTALMGLGMFSQPFAIILSTAGFALSIIVLNKFGILKL